MANQAGAGPDTLAAPPLRPFEQDTIPKIFFHGIDRHPHDSAMQYAEGTEWRSIAHAEVLARVSRLAAALEGLGVEAGDRVAILSENRPEWAIADLAVLGLGAADVPVYATLPAGQIAYILANAGVKAIFVSTPEQLEKILEIRDQVESLREIIAFDDPGQAEGVRSLTDVLEEGRRRIEAGEAADFRQRALRVDPEDLATLIYTSGTTGTPKGVMLTHRNLASNVAAVDQHDVLEVNPGEVALSFLPLSHVFERMVDYYYWSRGVSIAYVDAVDKVAQSMVQVRPHLLAAAPRVFEKIYTRVMGATGIKRAIVAWAARVAEDSADARMAGRGPRGFREKLADRLVFSKLRERTGGRVKLFVSGSAPLSAAIAKFFWGAGLPIYEGYGLTETSPVLTVNKPGAVRLGTVGPPIPGTELKIAETGEILARGPQVMKGYFEQPEATAQVIDSEGWFHTGDVGRIEPDGLLRITDRIKDIIVTAGGKNVAPAPIENAAATSPYVAQVVMVGDRRPFPALLVAPDFENLRAWAASQGIDASDPEKLAREPRVHQLLERETLGRLEGFARYEMPKKIAVIPRELTIETGELTPKMSIKRRVVEERYAGLIEEIYGKSTAGP